MCLRTDVLQEMGLVVQLVTLFLLGQYVKWRSCLAVVTINLVALDIMAILAACSSNFSKTLFTFKMGHKFPTGHVSPPAPTFRV